MASVTAVAAVAASSFVVSWATYYGSRSVSAALSKVYRGMASDEKAAWDTRVVSSVHATVLFVGAVWSLLLAGRQQSTAAFMGVILLAGIVVKNSILLIDFIEVAKEQGANTLQALTDSVRVRTRPIVMTAFGTAVGMVPIALERAIGLERLSPLAVVAIGGLMVSTFLTLLYVPIFYTIFEDLTNWVTELFRRVPTAVKQGDKPQEVIQHT